MNRFSDPSTDGGELVPRRPGLQAIAAFLVLALTLSACTSPPAGDRSRALDAALQEADAVYLCRVVITGAIIRYVVEEVWLEPADPRRRVASGGEVQPDPRRRVRGLASYGDRCLVIETPPTTSGSTAYSAFSISHGKVRFDGRSLEEVHAAIPERGTP